MDLRAVRKGAIVIKEMTNAETAAEIRRWCAQGAHLAFSWPTDMCGYEQHCRFVKHRNFEWKGGSFEDFKAFALAYADELERESHERALVLDPEANQ